MEASVRRTAWLQTVLFGLGFGYVEAAVVVYLRRLYYPNGFHFPLADLPREILRVEAVREFATLVMLLAVARLGARTGWGRFGLFALAFGVWDLTFYAALYVILGWPESLGTWDLLFILPKLWTGPVWSAAVIAVGLVGGGLLLFHLGEQRRLPRLGFAELALGAGALALLLYSFMANHDLVWHGGSPEQFPTTTWALGSLCGLASFASLVRRRRPTG